MVAHSLCLRKYQEAPHRSLWLLTSSRRCCKAIDWANAALCMDGKAPKARPTRLPKMARVEALMRLGLGLLRTGKPRPASDWLAAAQKAMSDAYHILWAKKFVRPKDVELRKLLKEAEMKRSPTWATRSIEHIVRRRITWANLGFSWSG